MKGLSQCYKLNLFIYLFIHLMKFPLNTRRKYGGCFTGIQWNYRRRRWNPFWCPKRHRIRFYRWRKMKVPAAAVKWSGRVCGRSTSATGCSTCGRSGWGSSSHTLAMCCFLAEWRLESGLSAQHRRSLEPSETTNSFFKKVRTRKFLSSLRW